jgi:hypothetical protein
MAKNWEVIEGEDTSLLVRSYKVKVIDGQKETWEEAAEDLTMNLDDLFTGFKALDEVQQAVVINGLKQKLDDAVARSKDQALTEKEKREVQEALWERIAKDRKWNMEAKATGPRGPSVSLATIVPTLAEAGFSADVIAKMTGKTVEVIQKFIETGEES